MTWQARPVTIAGRRVLVVDGVPPDDAPADVREGFARRALTNSGGTCPCGARWTMPPRAERRAAARRGEPVPVVIEHEPDCPAADENLLPAIRRWKGHP